MSKWIYLNLAIPIFIKIIIIPLIWMNVPTDAFVSIGIHIEYIILPVILILFNLYLFFSRIELSFLKCCFFMLLGLLIAEGIGYIIWIITTRNFKNLLHPDIKTMKTTGSLIIFYIFLVVLFFLLVKGGQLLFQVFQKIK